jgi:hypothetical protein
MTTMLNRIWFRRCLAALLASEGAYILGLTILLGLIWRDAGLSTDRWLARATVLIAAAFHVMVAIGALLGLLGLALRRSEPGSVVISVAGWSATVAAGLAVAFALAATTRPTSQRAVGA